MNHIKFLKSDPARARKILAESYKDAAERWQHRWLTDRHPCTWVPWRESLSMAFDHALQNLPASTEYDAVNAAVQRMIDDFIVTHLADAVPYTPRHVPRGAKRRRRSTIRSDNRHGVENGKPVESVWTMLDRDGEEARDEIIEHPNWAAYIIPRVRERRIKLGLEMLEAGMSLRAIREATNLRGPDLLRGWQKWCALLGVAA